MLVLDLVPSLKKAVRSSQASCEVLWALRPVVCRDFRLLLQQVASWIHLIQETVAGVCEAKRSVGHACAARPHLSRRE